MMAGSQTAVKMQANAGHWMATHQMPHEKDFNCDWRYPRCEPQPDLTAGDVFQPLMDAVENVLIHVQSYPPEVRQEFRRNLRAAVRHEAERLVLRAKMGMPCYLTWDSEQMLADPADKYMCDWYIENRKAAGIVEEPKRCPSCEARLDALEVKE